MNARLFFVLIPITFLLWLACEDNSSPDKTGETIKVAALETGGCNGMTFEQIANVRVEEYDTIRFSITNDTLDMFIGIQYACCAPFELEHRISADTLIVQIADTCTGLNCHCRCMCYYTWDVYFVDYQPKPYYFKVYLKELNASDYAIFRQGKIDLSKVN